MFPGILNFNWTMTTTKSGKQNEYIFFGILLILCLVISYTDYFKANPASGSYRISSDKAQYYVYLPATFIYGWDIHRFPENSDKERNGFVLDHQRNKIVTKTTYGAALLWSPFFLVAHFIELHENLEADGFSWFYERMTVIPGVVYLVLGLFFLRRFLSRYYSQWISYLTVILVFAGTNLYFYGIEDGLMSHVNSFFLFSLYLFLLKKFMLKSIRQKIERGK